MSGKSSHNLNSVQNGQNEGKKRKFLSNGTAISDPLQDDNRSLGSTTDEEDFWASISANERSVKLLSKHRKGSLALNQILLDLKSEKNQPEEYDEYADVDVKAIAAAISEELEGDDDSEHDSDSSGSGTVSEGSDYDDDSSDEESEHEVFDFENHINKLVKRENKSESASDNDSDSDGNESVNSEKVFNKAVEKAMKKIKRERSEEVVESDLESAKTSLKESETEDSPTSEDQSASEASDTEEENENAYKFQYLAPMLEANKVQNLRWPFSNLYVKELEQDPGMPLSDLEESLPSYRSTVATAFHPGRERNVMLGRVWWVEWWAKDDSRVGKYPDKSYLL